MCVYSLVCICVCVTVDEKKETNAEKIKMKIRSLECEISFECLCGRASSFVPSRQNAEQKKNTFSVLTKTQCVCMQLLVLVTCIFLSDFIHDYLSFSLCCCVHRESKSSMHVNSLHDRECPHSF